MAYSSSSRQTLHPISLDEIKDATDNFDERKILGHGGEGKVYLAEIRLGLKMTQVAVKQLIRNSEVFEKEIKTVSKIQHPNLISLLGYCDESGQKILLYEFMEKGSLSSYVKEKSSISLSWQQRLRICLGAARGLQHLHAETDEFPKGIIHRDVKPDNILLDKNWVAKISDFGLFKLSHVGQIQSAMITNLKGTGGYYAPEYVTYRSITRKIDVYAFGVVLFQVLCLKMPWDRGDESYYSTDDEDLGIWALQNVDTKIKEEICDDSLKAFTVIVGKSLKKDPRKRPTMDGVVLALENALIFQKSEDEAKQPRTPPESDQKSDRDFVETEAVLKKIFEALKSDNHSSGSSGINKEEERERERRLSSNSSKEKLLEDSNLPAKHLSEEARQRAQRNWHKAASLVKNTRRFKTRSQGQPTEASLVKNSRRFKTRSQAQPTEDDFLETDAVLKKLFQVVHNEERERERRQFKSNMEMFLEDYHLPAKPLSEKARQRAQRNWRKVASHVKNGRFGHGHDRVKRSRATKTKALINKFALSLASGLSNII